MKIAIHQPNYIPWIGFFDKMDQVDTFILLDKALYSKGAFINRNKIKTPQGELMLTVPIKNKRRPINEIEIDHSTNWRRRHWKMIESNYRNCRYWGTYQEGLSQIYEQEWRRLSALNIALIKQIMYALNMDTTIILESDFNKDFGKQNSRNINIVKEVNGEIYISGTGARAYNDENQFNEAGIHLQYQSFNHPEYPQRFGLFISHLSIIDMLFNCGPQTMKILRNLREN